MEEIDQRNAVKISDELAAMGFIVKDSGTRQHFQSGMQRDVTTDKTDYSLVLDGPMFERWATHLTKGAKKYTKRNWMQANSQEELDRFRESALRHFLQWYRGEVDEDHGSAVLFNINGAEYTKERTKRPFRKMGDEQPCGSRAPTSPSWSCERAMDHTGKHMAWDDYESRVLYPGGEW